MAFVFVFVLVLALSACATRHAAPVGAWCPWTTYEAEAGRTNGTVCGPSREYRTPEAESSGRMHVRLDATGQYVEFTATQVANGLVLRYGIPDGPEGAGSNATLSLYVNGAFARKLDLTSHFAWVYGDYPWTDQPKDGKAHRFFDEFHVLIGQVVPGDTLRLQKDVADDAAYYLIDFVELEQVAPPLPQPPGSLSVVNFGAIPGDGLEDADALLRCVAAAKAQGAVVWIPEGVFSVGSALRIGGTAVRGAGMWHTTLTGSAAEFKGTGEALSIADLAIFGDATRRKDSSLDNAFSGNFGTGSDFARLWIEHTKCGVWTNHGTQRLRIAGCRIRNTMADGINLCDGTSHSVVEQCHLRNTGDDALATWSPTGSWSSKQPCVGNRFVLNTIQLPWLANGIGLYGGTDHVVMGNLVVDTVFSAGGIDISSAHEAVPFSGRILVSGNTLVRTGGDCYIGDQVGSLWFHAKDADIAADIVVEDLVVREPGNSAVTIHGPHSVSNLVLRRITVEGEAQHLLHVKAGAKGSLTVSGMAMMPLLQAAVRNDAAGHCVVFDATAEVAPTVARPQQR